MTNAARGSEPGQTDTPATADAAWQLDPARSSASFSHKTIWGLVTVRGTFGELSGSGERLADGTGRGRLEFSAASIDTKHAKRDQHLRSADFFNTAEHPAIVADFGKIVQQPDGQALAVGTLTVAGQTRPLSLTATITESSAEAITLSAEADIDRSEFGMSWNQLGMLTGKAHVAIAARFVSAPAS